MKKHLFVLTLVGIITITNTSFKTSSRNEKIISNNIAALATFDKKLGQTCTMGCRVLDYFYVCVMCGLQPTDPCERFDFHSEGIGERSTCGAED